MSRPFCRRRKDREGVPEKIFPVAVAELRGPRWGRRELNRDSSKLPPPLHLAATPGSSVTQEALALDFVLIEDATGFKKIYSVLGSSILAH